MGPLKVYHGRGKEDISDQNKRAVFTGRVSTLFAGLKVLRQDRGYKATRCDGAERSKRRPVRTTALLGCTCSHVSFWVPRGTLSQPDQLNYFKRLHLTGIIEFKRAQAVQYRERSELKKYR